MADSEKTYEADVTKENGDVTITAQVTWETLENYREEAVSNLQENVELDGFRKGNIPEDVLEDHIGEMGLVSEMAQIAIQDIYPKIVADKEIQTIGRPDVKITKISKGNPLEFEATTTAMPTVELPDNYRELAKEAHDEATKEAEESGGEASDEDVDEAIQTIRRQMAQAEMQQKMQEADDEDFDPSDLEVTDEDLPELNGEFVKKISNDETVEEFKATLKQNIGQQNERKAGEARRSAMIEAVVEASTAELPTLVVDGELDKMMAQFESDIARSGMELEDYFEQTDTSKEDMRDKWRPDAKKRAKTQLVLNKIAAENDIQADDEAVQKEVEQIKEQYQEIPEARAQMFVRSRMINENTIKFLAGEEEA